MEADETLVELRRFDAVHEAALAASALETRGIECEVRDGFVTGALPELARATGGVTLLVRRDELDAARRLLDSPGENMVASRVTDDEFPQATCAGCGGPLDDPLAACLECNAHPDRELLTPKRTQLAIVKLKLWILVITVAAIFAPMLWARIWDRITDLPENLVMIGAWLLVAVVVGFVLTRALARFDTRL